MSKFKNLSDGLAGRGNKEYISLPEVPLTRESVVRFLYAVHGAALLYVIYLLITGDYLLGSLIFITGVANLYFTVKDANKSKWGLDE